MARASFRHAWVGLMLAAAFASQPTCARAQSVLTPEMLAARQRADKHMAAGRVSEAIKDYELGVALIERARGREDPLLFKFLTPLATAYMAVSEYERAETAFLRRLQIQEKISGPQHPSTAWPLANLGTLYGDMGDLSRAEACFQRALRLFEKGYRNDALLAEILTGKSKMYMHTAQPEKAEPLCDRALPLWQAAAGPNSYDMVMALNNQAVVCCALKKFDKAERVLQQSLQIASMLEGVNGERTAKVLGILGGLYAEQNRFDEAEACFRRDLAIGESKFGADSLYVVQSLKDLGLTERLRGNFAQAEKLYLRAFKIREAYLPPDGMMRAKDMNELAELYGELGRWDEAFPLADRSFRLYRRYIVSQLPAMSESVQLRFLAMASDRNPVSLALGRPNDPHVASLSAGWNLNSKGVAVDTLAEQALVLRDTADAQLGPSTQELRRVRAELSRLSFSTPGPDGAPQLADRLRRLKGRSDWYRPARYLAWVIPPRGNGDVRLVELGPAAEIDSAIANARKAMADAAAPGGALERLHETESEKAVRTALDVVSRRVLRPLLPEIENAERWVISPDASLWLLPWAALTLPDGSYVVEKHEVQCVISGRDLVARPPAMTTSAPVVLADPDFDLGPEQLAAALREIVPDRAQLSETRAARPATGRARAVRLPGTAVEAQLVAPLLKRIAGTDPVVYTGRWALESVFKAVHRPRVAVFCTHGFFIEPDSVEQADEPIDFFEDAAPSRQEGNPLLRCGLLLAGFNSRGEDGSPAAEDGVLTGLEIVGIDLRGTELVMLSACQTGLGQLRSGEGAVGLRQAFQLAGARAVVATLWPVADEESARLSGAFFEALASGKGKSEALRTAQLAMIRERRQRLGAAHPHYWAAYTVTGGD